ncbi:hypothetical protein LCGC14_1445170 [marine sediment metagenome]|uniref:Uncharacterized protein n=1 Tax=marine sediment metagenome TaxID=412755 RepID=A0A0F9JJE8_9ZZZZ
MEKKVYIDGYYKQLLDDFKNAVEKHNTSIVIIFDGKSGKGKTTLSNQTGYYLYPNFNLKNIYYEPETFLKGLAEAKQGSYHSFDEAMILSSRSAMSTVNKMIIQAMSMIRSKRIYVSFCVNSIFDLDRNLVLSRADALMHVYGEGLVDRGRFAAFFKAKGDNFDRIKLLYLYGKKFYDYSKPRANFIGRFVKEFIVNEVKYEVEKQIAIDKFLTQEPTTKRQRSYQTLIFKLVRFDGYSTKKVAEYAEVDIKTIQNILNRFKNSPNIPNNHEKEKRK